MISTKIYFDCRKPDKLGRGCLYVSITSKGERAMLSLGIKILPDEWDRDSYTVKCHPDKKILNSLVSAKLATVNQTLARLSLAGELGGRTLKDILPILKETLDPSLKTLRLEREAEANIERNSFGLHFKGFYKCKASGTRKLYEGTEKKMREYCDTNQIDYDSLSFDCFNVKWLESFEQHCLKTEKQNTVAIHLRNIRAAFNAAIDEDRTTNYPFRKFKIKRELSVDKSYSACELRTLFNHKCYPGGEQEAVDIFKLIFCLIGINTIDLANLKPIAKGRVNYIRAKTHKTYSIKLEPEALDIVKRYKGQKNLLNILERCPNYKTYFNRLGKTLRKVGLERVPGKKNVGKSILPDVCTGSARTSWATIAQEELDIPRDVIAAALGHHTVDVTSTYLRTDWKKKVDAANRKVLDWVFYGKK